MINKDSMLLIGIGEAGGKVVSEILKKDSRYIGLFVNTSYKDILKLSNAKNIYTVPNADGTGRNRSKAQAYAKEYANSIIDQIDRFPLQLQIFVFFSYGGGTGSGISPILIRLLGKIRPNKVINIVGILPSFDESKKTKTNAIQCWNEISATPNINLSFLLDNNKRENKEDINIEFAERFNAMMDISKANNDSLTVIDSADSEILISAKGSASIYILPNKERDAKVAIEKAIKDSIFADYSKDLCEYLAISLLPNSELKRNNIVDYFQPSEDKFIEGCNKKYNLVVATGCDLELQRGAIELLDVSLSESIVERTKSSVRDLMVGEKKVNKPIKEESIHAENIKQQEKNVDDILKDDKLWDDIMNM